MVPCCAGLGWRAQGPEAAPVIGPGNPAIRVPWETAPRRLIGDLVEDGIEASRTRQGEKK
jgi:hypothetical protein